MPLNFQPQAASSFDPATGISIPQPRILPATLPGGQPGTEYQYAFIRDGRMVGGLGFSGTDAITEVAGRKEWVFTLDLGRERLITSMLEFKQTLGNGDDDFAFVRGLAEGLVLAYAGRTDNKGSVRYVAVTTLDALIRAGVDLRDEADALTDGSIVLAEVAILGHGEQGRGIDECQLGDQSCR